MSNSEFAKRQMKKHGWTEGAGLGKDERGMADPIKVSLKMDKTGVGHDPGKEFTDHWWLRVFNETAQKIGKKKSDAPVQTEEEKAKSQKELRRKNFYKGFVQSATLTNGIEEKTVSSSSSEDEDESNTTSVPTLDDIHKFCGGATGHKAANFGFKLGGKVKRASLHEKTFEEQIQNCDPNSSKNHVGDLSLLDVSSNGTDETTSKERKKHKKKKSKGGEELDESNVVDESQQEGASESSKRKLAGVGQENVDVENGVESSSKKRKKSKKDKGDKDVDVNSNEVEVVNSDGDGKGEKRKRKKKDKEIDSCNDATNENGCVGEKNGAVVEDDESAPTLETAQEVDNSCSEKKKKKKKSKDKGETENTEIANETEMNDVSETASEEASEKKKKRKKNKEENNCDENESQSTISPDSESKDKKKKKKRKNKDVDGEGQKVPNETEGVVKKKKKSKKDKV